MIDDKIKNIDNTNNANTSSMNNPDTVDSGSNNMEISNLGCIESRLCQYGHTF